MKLLASEHADIRAPAEVVFEYVSDLARWPTWFECVVSAATSDEKPVALGEEIHLCLHAGRRRWQEELEVTRFIRNAFLSFESLYSTARRIDFRFERRGQLTRLGAAIGYPVFGGLMPAAYHALVGRRKVAKGLRDSLVHLKNILEERIEETVFAGEASIMEGVVGPVRAATPQGVRVG